MKLRDWRNQRKLTLRACAAALGIPHARNYQRYEIGMVLPDSPMIERICTMTGGQVTAQDHHEQRVEWLEHNKPELLAGVHDAHVAEFTEAAE